MTRHVLASIGVVVALLMGCEKAGMTSRIEKLARTDHVTLLDLCLTHYRTSQYRDYTCKFTKQERLFGTLNKEEVIEVKFMQTPFSVFMRWTQNPLHAERLLYVEGKWNDQMLVNPSGLSAVAGTVKLPTDGLQAMKDALHPVTEYGFEQTMRSLKTVLFNQEAIKVGDLRQESGGYADVGGRKTIVLIHYFPGYPAHKMITCIDLEYLVPIKIEGFDADGQLAFRYVFSDIHFNTGLSSNDFLPKANHMSDPG